MIEGRAIARTFWGKAWCDNLERYSDFANRLPRGPHLRPQRLGHGPADRRRAGDGARERQRAVPDLHRDRALSPRRWRALIRRLRGPDRLARGAPAGPVLASGDGDADPPGGRPLPVAQGDRVRVLLPRLGGDVQARRGDPLRRRRAPRRRARAALPAAAGRSAGPALRGQPRAVCRTQARGTRKRIAGTALGEVFGIELDESPPAGSMHPAPASRTRRGPGAGRRRDSAWTGSRPRSRSSPRGAPPRGPSRSQERPVGSIPRGFPLPASGDQRVTERRTRARWTAAVGPHSESHPRTRPGRRISLDSSARRP